MMVSFLLGKQNFSFIIEGRTGEKQWGCPLTAVRRVLGCIPEREKRGAADAAGCVEGLCSLALRGRKFGCPLSAYRCLLRAGLYSL